MKRISMSRTAMSCCMAVILCIQSLSLSAQDNPGKTWQQYANAEDAGFSSDLLEQAKAKYDQMLSSGLMVVHKGKVLLAWDDVSRRFLTHSMRKSLMSAMYGIYEQRGQINLESRLSELGIDDIQGLTNTEKEARVLDLITARSGIYHPAAYEPRSMKENRPERGVSKPGESFNYNNWDFNTLLTILEQEANIRFFDEFQRLIAKPLGMEDLRASDMRYRYERDLSEHPAYLFKMSARDLARFGQLYLNKGRWNGKQIVPSDWVAKSTAAFSTDLGRFGNRGGYGYLWWVDNTSFEQPAYYASGLGGHKVYVLPETEMVIVHRVNSYLNMGVRDNDLKELIKLILKAKTGEIKSSPKLKALETNSMTYPKAKVSRAEMKQYEGVYTHRFFREFEVYIDGGWLKTKGEVMGNFRLHPKGDGAYIIEDLPELPLQFEKATADHPRGTSVTLTNERRIPTKFVVYY